MKMMRMAALALILTTALPVSAMAAFTVKMGARINQEIGWDFTSKEQSVNQKDDLTDSFLNLANTSYLRATFMSEDKKVGAQIEAGLSDGTFIYTRRAYGWYKMGDVTFLAGRTDNWQGGAGAYWTQQKLVQGPTTSEAWGWGKAWHPRKPKLQVTWRSGAFGLQASLEKPIGMPLSYPVGGVDVVNKFPALALALDYSGKWFSVTPAFIWTQWQAEGDTQGFDDSLNAYGFILPAAIKAGGFKLILELHYATNPTGLYQDYNTYGVAAVSGTGFEDTRLWGGLAEASFRTGKLTMALGLGVESFSNDAWKKSLGWKDDNTTRYLAWLALPYQAHRYFTIRPEIDYFHYGGQPGDQTGRGPHPDLRGAVQVRFLAAVSKSTRRKPLAVSSGPEGIPPSR